MFQIRWFGSSGDEETSDCDRNLSIAGNARASTLFILSVERQLRSSILLTLVVAILQHAYGRHDPAAAQIVYVALTLNL